MRRKVQLLAVVALTCALVAGCGSEEPPPTAGDIRAAQDAFAYPLYWAGTKVDGLPLTSLITKHVAAPTVGYGICKASSDSGCALPVSIQTDSICERNALAHSRAASSSRHVRGVIARADGEGTIEIPTGVSNVTVFARPEHLERVLAALRPVADTSASAAARLPQPRYPFEYVDELRGVRDAYARTGRIRAVRDQPAISRRAVRFRLRLAEDWAPTGCAGRDASSPENRARSSRRGLTGTSTGS